MDEAEHPFRQRPMIARADAAALADEQVLAARSYTGAVHRGVCLRGPEVASAEER